MRCNGIFNEKAYFIANVPLKIGQNYDDVMIRTWWYKGYSLDHSVFVSLFVSAESIKTMKHTKQ